MRSDLIYMFLQKYKSNKVRSTLISLFCGFFSVRKEKYEIKQGKEKRKGTKPQTKIIIQGCPRETTAETGGKKQGKKRGRAGQREARKDGESNIAKREDKDLKNRNQPPRNRKKHRKRAKKQGENKAQGKKKDLKKKNKTKYNRPPKDKDKKSKSNTKTQNKQSNKKGVPNKRRQSRKPKYSGKKKTSLDTTPRIGEMRKPRHIPGSKPRLPVTEPTSHMALSATARAPEPMQDHFMGEDFASLLDETLGRDTGFDGSVVTGRIVRLTDEFAIVDVGLKSEGRVLLKEFAPPGMKPEIKPGDHVVFPSSAGSWVEVDEERLLVCRVAEILGVLEEIRDAADDGMTLA